MREAFIEKSFNKSNQAMIILVNSILDEYRAQGFRLSLRQLYYQLVARDYIPNDKQSYKRLGVLVSNARQAGLIDWDMIEDRNRETVALTHWDNPGEIVHAAANSFRIDKWENQPWHVEVMVEKDALSGVLLPVCRELDISVTANKGYSSSSTMYEIGKRLGRYMEWYDKSICVLYLGDHDPSGIDMTRDVEDRLRMYSKVGDLELTDWGGEFVVERLALNWEQIQIWRPPENPAKETDTRSAIYIARFGDSSWELDAVEPGELAELVREAVLDKRDEELWQESLDKEAGMTAELQSFAGKYNKESE